MGQKIFCIIFLLCALASAEIGHITALSGSILVSRNNEVYQPLLSSRIYEQDWLLCSANSYLEIKTISNKLLKIKGPAQIQMLNANNYSGGLNNTEVIDLPPVEPKTKSLQKALTYTAIYPGWGHYYIQDYPKALPLSLASGYMLYNIFTLNPGQSETYEAQIKNQKEYFLQVYFVYWALSLLDITAETNVYNKKIEAEAGALKVAWSIEL